MLRIDHPDFRNLRFNKPMLIKRFYIRIQTNNVKLSNLHKIEKCGKKIGKMINKIGKIGTFTWSVLALHLPLKYMMNK